MKKLLFVFMIAVLLVQGVWSNGEQEVPYTDFTYVENISNKFESGASVKYDFGTYSKRVYFFSGFKFEDFRRNYPGIVELNRHERTIINSETSGAPYAIIGHSQGGLRALGYISQLANPDNNYLRGDPNLIDAVITTAGIDQGLKAIEYGAENLVARTKEKINIVANGIVSIAGIFPVTDILVTAAARTLVVPRVTDTALNILGTIFLKEWRNYGIFVWNGNVPQQIRDMEPASSYITQNVIGPRSYTYKVFRGYVPTVEWRSQTLFWGLKVPYFVIVQKPYYTYHTETETVTKFNPNVPVGFIVGTNNNALEMLDEPYSDTYENITRGALIGAGAVFSTTGVVHIAKCATLWGFFTGSPIYAVDAARAAVFCFNIDSEINDLIGSREGDGLVAKSHQYIPQTLLRNPVLGGKSEGYVSLPYTHDKLGTDKWNEPPPAIMQAKDMIIQGEQERVNQGLR